ncbi:hypothetical protein OR1_01681 [Geobacter sp. OR-1]|uniref:DUF2169 family type VI secretion system accessory protein n=1 Tax=Geobacter sp. OR-1 TaxID=1266765 RepID=UPI0005436681|nr:DUF2169 domain-containing protein [Geobacter sp. OR-1]GAM09403.1 hypothetical protein OR1_01681 [Geobacter sp. OR-1]
MEIINNTPFAAERLAYFNQNGEESFLFLLKATYAITPKNTIPRIAEEQNAFNAADVYAGEPGKSGLLLAGDFSLPKPSTGITLTGHAFAPNRDTPYAEVVIKVGEVIQRAIVFGDRYWCTSGGSTWISKPLPFESIPLVWENAFGGVDGSSGDRGNTQFFPENPVGTGFLATETKRIIDGLKLPNIEHPQYLIRNPKDLVPTIGFCPVAPHWQPRLSYTGTCDANWLEERAPLLPDDFDDRFYQTAPPGLIAHKYLSGGEHCLITGTTPQGKLEFDLPTVTPCFKVRLPKSQVNLLGCLDTVHIDTDGMKLYMIWRATKMVHGYLETTRAVEVSLTENS